MLKDFTLIVVNKWNPDKNKQYKFKISITVVS